MALPIEIETIEGEDTFLVARPESPSGVVLTQTEVSAATLAVYEMGVNAAVYTKTLAVLNNPPGVGYDECMFLTLQDDGWWDLTGGYTFWAVIKYSDYALEGGKTYRIEVKLTTGHNAIAWPNLDDYGDILFVWNTTPQAVSSL